MRMTSISDGSRHVETVVGEPGETERFIAERGLFGGNVSQYVTLRHELVRYRDGEGNTYWIAGHRDTNKRVGTALHEAVVAAAYGDGAAAEGWWPAVP